MSSPLASSNIECRTANLLPPNCIDYISSFMEFIDGKYGNFKLLAFCFFFLFLS